MRRDGDAMTGRLTRLGDKLDAATGDDWPRLRDDYTALAIKRALSARPPKVQIKSRTAYWHTLTVLIAAYNRVKDLKAQLEGRMVGSRAMADLKAAHAVAHRDWQVIAAVVRDYEAKQKRSIAAWQRARRLVKIPARDRLPQR